MRTEELMTGNFVKIKNSGVIIKIEAIHKKKVGCHSTPNKLTWVRTDLLEPIPITPLSLRQNGFYKANAGVIGFFEESYSNSTVEVSLSNVYIDERSNQLHIEDPDSQTVFLHMMQCNYLHQLQNAFRVCGIKKEIEI